MVLAYFPKPYFGEILYSVLARYRIRIGSVGIKEIIKDLFGSTNVIATVDLPSHIDALIKNLPQGFPITAKRIINEHTLYPYYKPFLPMRQAEAVFNLMRGEKGGGIHFIAGIMASAVPSPRYLRFCPLCLIEQRKILGEGFWQRLHQAPGVLVCPKHITLVSNSRIIIPGQNKHQYISPDEDCCTLIPRIVKYNSKTLEILASISRDVEWLMQVVLSPLELGKYQQHYLAFLIDRGLATATGRVHQRDLAKSFIQFYGGDLLKALDSDFDICSQAHWLAGIVRKHRKSFHPIRHLLMMRFLAGSAKEFFSRLSTYSPFGEGPWPCLNAAAGHYLQPVVKEIRITRCSDTKRPVGTFSCECGFVYSRRGPDESEADRYKIGRIKNFGPVWHNKLAGLVAQNLSLRAMARILRVETNTIKKHANALSGNCSPELSQLHAPTIDEIGVSTVVSKNKEVCIHHNNANQNQRTATNKMQKSRINWEERDTEVLSKVKDIVAEIRLSPDKPIRITIGSIGKKLGLRPLLEKKLDKLPLTKTFLGHVVESTEDFQKRRVKWAAKELQKRGEALAAWKIKRLAGLRKNVSKDVEQAIENQVCNNLVNLTLGKNENRI